MSGVLHPARRRHRPPPGDRARPRLPSGGPAVTLTSPQPALLAPPPRRSSTTPASARRPRSLADGTVLSHAGLAERVADRARTLGSRAAPGPGRGHERPRLARRLPRRRSSTGTWPWSCPTAATPSARRSVAAYDPDIVCLRRRRDDVRRPMTAHDLHPDLALLLSTSGTTGLPQARAALARQRRQQRGRHRRLPRAHAGRPGDHHAAAALLLRPLGAALAPRRRGQRRADRAERGRRVLLGALHPLRRDELRRRAAHLRPPRRERVRGPRPPVAAAGDPGRRPPRPRRRTPLEQVRPRPAAGTSS